MKTISGGELFCASLTETNLFFTALCTETYVLSVFVLQDWTWGV